MARPTRSKGQREEDLLFIARLYIHGDSQREIAEKLAGERDYAVTARTICRDIQDLLKRWRESAAIEIGLAKGVELERLNRLEREAWQAWERSKKTATKRIREVRGGEGPFTRIQVQRDERDGDPRYLQLVQGCIDRRCAILGLNESALAELERRIMTIEGVRVS
jgi:hypothetical protein